MRTSATHHNIIVLSQTYNQKADDWIKEKLEMQNKVRELEDSIRRSAGDQGWDLERERFKHILDDRDNQITQLKIEGDVARSQVGQMAEEMSRSAKFIFGLVLLRGSCQVSMFIHKPLDQRRACPAF